MLDIGKLAFDIIGTLVKELIKSTVKLDSLPFLQKMRIDSRIDSSIALVVEPLIPFLQNEKLSTDQIERLLVTFGREFAPVTKDASLLFENSLDGSKIFERFYQGRKLPQDIVESGLADVFLLIGPRVLTILSQIPFIVKDWEREAWHENFRRLDEISDSLREIFSRIDSQKADVDGESVSLITRIRRTMSQRIRFDYELTGLRSERPVVGDFGKFFVHPSIVQELLEKRKKKEFRVETHESSIVTFVRTCNRSLVVAPAGSGKSTWSKWLQLGALVDSWGGICIRFEFRAMRQPLTVSLIELLRQEAGLHLAEEITPSFVKQLCANGKLLILLDGFDELKKSDRNSAFDWISDLSLAYTNASIVITTRPLTSDHIIRLRNAEWRVFEIEPFDLPRINDFICRWYLYSPNLSEELRKTDAESLSSRLHGDPTIAPLTGNPLLLSTLLMVNYLDGSLPSGRSQLYSRYIEGMLGVWDDRRSVKANDIELKIDEKRQIIRGLALKMFFRGVDQVEEQEAIEWISASLDAQKRSSTALVLDQLRERTGLIIGPGVYSFSHKSIAEFLVATAIVQGDQSDEAGRRVDRLRLYENRDNDQWNTVIFLWAGLAPVYEVEHFIITCTTDKSVSLAAGVLLDQFSKFTSEIRRKLVLNLLKAISDSDLKGDRVAYATCGPEDHEELRLEIPSFELRRLTPYSEFHSLLSTALNDGCINVRDAENLKSQKLRELFWMLLIGEVRQRESYALIRALGHPECATKEAWINWAAHSVVRRLAMDNSDQWQGRLDDFLEHFVDYRPYIVTSVLAVILSIRDERFREISFNVDILLDVLVYTGDYPVNASLLTGTKCWKIYGSDAFDLLEKSSKLVGEIAKDSIKTKALSIIERLRKERHNI